MEDPNSKLGFVVYQVPQCAENAIYATHGKLSFPGSAKSAEVSEVSMQERQAAPDLGNNGQKSGSALENRSSRWARKLDSALHRVLDRGISSSSSAPSSPRGDDCGSVSGESQLEHGGIEFPMHSGSVVICLEQELSEPLQHTNGDPTNPPILPMSVASVRKNSSLSRREKKAITAAIRSSRSGPGGKRICANWDDLPCQVMNLLGNSKNVSEDEPLELSRVRCLFGIRFGLALDHKALGYARLSSLFRDSRLAGICRVVRKGRFNFLEPAL
eukprot:gnl/MRDRNA2_/MRDRNA2_58014_c0_seq2.p1 gnl/MRDRNA2_/MRDRNA2_58014_c0~~gnl/MRDRNA2_/MRDRNA2_58014_c0_seq2.p1  ORF type:complete len:272 (-),score=55.75 gnl/MRDRNA2_/MRDRNA2_58014_c0_seq2:102-917(-)